MNPVVNIVLARSDGDCAIVVLAMYLGRSYEDVLGQAAQLDAEIHRRGMWVHQIERTAKALGVPLRRRRSYDLEEDDGILSLDSTNGEAAHVVLLRAGLIFNVNGTVWEPDVYLSHEKYAPKCLLVRKNDEP